MLFQAKNVINTDADGFVIIISSVFHIVRFSLYQWYEFWFSWVLYFPQLTKVSKFLFSFCLRFFFSFYFLCHVWSIVYRNVYVVSSLFWDKFVHKYLNKFHSIRNINYVLAEKYFNFYYNRRGDYYIYRNIYSVYPSFSYYLSTHNFKVYFYDES